MEDRTDEITIKVIYDNKSADPAFQSDWGFSCLIEGLEDTILFDAGTNPEILMHNARAMKVDFTEIDLIALSHHHHDHVGGLKAVLEKTNGIKIVHPKSFPGMFLNEIKKHGAVSVKIDGPEEISRNVWTTGEMGRSIVEQSLAIQSSKGLIVITGCAHPGIVEIVRKARKIAADQVLLVMGGFHLMDKSKKDMKDILNRFDRLNVKYAGACHCTGDKSIKAFQEHFGVRFIEIGAGKVIRVSELS